MQHNQAFLQLVDNARASVQEITVEQAREWQLAGKDFLLVDVREQSEWAAGHFPGAIYLGKGIIERDIEAVEPNRDRCIVLYCGGGFRSVLSAVNLQLMGYTQVISMDGGYRDWKAKGYPIVND